MSILRHHHADAVCQPSANQPIDPDWPLFEGVSCVPPFVNRANGTCVLGGQPSYVVNVSTGKFKSSILAEVDHSNIRLSIIMAQIQLAVNFARNLNLRLNVKNKGHDFNAKSTGGGALSIWTTWLQDIEYLGDEQYGGQALKIGSGVSAEQLYKFVDGLGLMVTGPIARTVGLSGGYLLGGGNSPLIGKFGMGADQIISMEVVLPDGTLVSVSEKLYPELFYALRGGGGATYGVVTSYVIRVYQTIPMSSLTYSFSTGGNVSADIFWKGVDAISTYYAEWAKLGLYTYWMTTCTDKTTCTFVMNPQYAPNMTTTELAALNVPFFSNMSDLGIPLTGVNYTDWPSYLEFFEQTWPESTSVCGVWTLHTASRFFPQSVFEDITKFNAMTASIRNVSETRGMVIGYNIQPGVLADPFLNQTNAVSPAWREIVLYVMSNYMWDTTASPEDIAADNKLLVDALDPWREIAPNAEGGGAYLNEADINEPDFQHAFWGSNYEYLYEVKQRYDPWGVFYAATAVGSEDWYITDQIAYYPTQYGRLCPVQY